MGREPAPSLMESAGIRGESSLVYCPPVPEESLETPTDPGAVKELVRRDLAC